VPRSRGMQPRKPAGPRTTVPEKDFAGGGEPPATDLDVLGGAAPADGVYVG
jgi:hypothetical protein